MRAISVMTWRAQFEQEGVHRGLGVLEHVGGGVAEGVEGGVIFLEECDGGFALVAAGFVFAAGEGVLDVGIADDDAEVGIVERDLPGGVVAAVNKECVSGLAHGGNELVHDAAGDAGIVVFGPLRGERDIDERHGGVVDGEKSESGGDFKGGGGREAAADGDVGIDDRVHAAGDRGTLADGFGGTFGVEGPGGSADGDWACDGEFNGFVGEERVHSDFRIGARGAEDEGGLVDGHGADEAVVVVGVFADEVDAPGSANGEGGFLVGEEVGEFLLEGGGVHVGVSRYNLWVRDKGVNGSADLGWMQCGGERGGKRGCEKKWS